MLSCCSNCAQLMLKLCSAGAQIVLGWCSNCARLVLTLCSAGAQTVLGWCSNCARLVLKLCSAGAQIVLGWCSNCAFLVVPLVLVLVVLWTFPCPGFFFQFFRSYFCGLLTVCCGGTGTARNCFSRRKRIGSMHSRGPTPLAAGATSPSTPACCSGSRSEAGTETVALHSAT